MKSFSNAIATLSLCSIALVAFSPSVNAQFGLFKGNKDEDAAEESKPKKKKENSFFGGLKNAGNAVGGALKDGADSISNAVESRVSNSANAAKAPPADPYAEYTAKILSDQQLIALLQFLQGQPINTALFTGRIDGEISIETATTLIVEDRRAREQMHALQIEQITAGIEQMAIAMQQSAMANAPSNPIAILGGGSKPAGGFNPLDSLMGGGGSLADLVVGEVVKGVVEETTLSDEEMVAIVKKKDTSLRKLRRQLEKDYDELQSDFLKVIGVSDDNKKAPRGSLIASVEKLNKALQKLNLPTEEELRVDLISVNMGYFVDDSGALDHARFTTVAAALEGEVAKQAHLLNGMLAKELTNEQKKTVVKRFDEFMASLSKVRDAESKYLAASEKFKQEALVKKDEATEVMNQDNGKLIATLVVKGYIRKEAADEIMDSDNFAAKAAGGLVALQGILESIEGGAAVWSSYQESANFWKGIEEKDIQFLEAKEGIRKSILVVNTQYDQTYKKVSEIADEIGVEMLQTYFEEYYESQDETL